MFSEKILGKYLKGDESTLRHRVNDVLFAFDGIDEGDESLVCVNDKIIKRNANLK